MADPGGTGRDGVGTAVFSATSMREANAAWAQARGAGPVVRTGEPDGLWLLTRYEEVCCAFRDWELYSSRRTDPQESAITVAKTRVPLMVPLELDPPEWFPIRRILAELLSPAASEALRPRVRHWVDHYLGRVLPTGRCDFVKDLAVPVPAAVTMEWLGFPEDDWVPLASVFHEIPAYRAGHPTREAAVARFGQVIAACLRELDDRRLRPRADVLSAIANYRIDNQEVDLDLLALLVTQVIGGGVDTTTGLTSAAVVHLGRDVTLRKRLATEPGSWSTATEEFLRMYPPVRTFARTVSSGSELGGCPMHQGDRVVLSMISANFDEGVFSDPDRFDADRDPNRHVTFGMGIHRCPGSHLARIMFVEMLQAVLERMPEYELLEDQIEEYPNWGAMGGWAHIPATFAPSR